MERDSSPESSIHSLTESKFEELPAIWTKAVIEDDECNTSKNDITNVLKYTVVNLNEFKNLAHHNSRRSISQLKSIFIFLLPSFITSPKAQDSNENISPTAWLDGLRGIGSLFVLFTHYNLVFNPRLRVESNSDGYNILQWPMIRVVHSGGAAVGIFYIISGYALSFRALCLLHRGDIETFSKSLASSTFRRAFRLFLPMNVSTFFAMIFIYFDWYGKGMGAAAPPQLPTFWLQFKDWCTETVLLSDPLFSILNSPYPPKYDGALWTIPLEFQGSLVVFLILLGVARTKTLARVIIVSGLFCFCIYRQYVEMVLFIGGVLIAEFTLTRALWRKRGVNPSELQIPPNQDFNILSIKHILLTISFLVSVYILGIPEGPDNQAAHGYSVLVYLTPTSYKINERNSLWFWIDVGGLLAVITLGLAPFLQRFFTTRFALYLGKISYSLYLVHVKLLYTLGWHMIPKFLAMTGNSTIFQRVLGHFIGGGLLGFCVVWAADVFHRGVDEPIMTGIRWATDKCFVI